ncbi:MAG: two-component sensor histidine kinase, partial [Mesorhizobium sp.]
TALHIDTPRLAGMSEEDKDRLARNLRLAEQLGADITTIPGQNVAQDIVRHATTNNFTHIVIGRPTRSRWRELIEGSLTYDLIRNAGDISVHVISGAERDTDTPSARLKAATEQKPFQIWPYLISTVYVAGALAVSSILDQFLDVRNLASVLLLAVLTSAVTFGLWPALYA